MSDILVANEESAHAARFAIARQLGRGAQGTVHLAFDKRLKRDVAIKRIARRVGTRGMASEAQAVSRLQHPNIVSLHDAFSEQDSDVLIFEFVEGETLSAYIARNQRAVDIPERLSLVVAILEGLHFAHRSGVVHCDVKPANVILDKAGTPRLTDFGIAAEVGRKVEGVPCTGTPSYLAPEIANGAAPTPKSDVFSAGIMLYELLAGAPPIVGSNVFEIIHRMSTETLVPPSQRNPQIEPRLEQIIMRAIARNPDDRFESAKAFGGALTEYMTGGQDAAADGASGKEKGSATVDFLLQRMRIRGDFPALGEAISAINRIAASETESVSSLTSVILKDVSLTNKLLRMVNTVCFKRFGGSISTISRAVAILGFDAVRNSALSLILFEHLKKSDQRGELKKMMAKSFLASEIARGLSGHLHGETAEEGAIAAMFFDLGKLLVTFYLYEEAQQIARRVVQSGESEDKAAREVVGISFAGLGVAIAKRWGFPENLVGALSRVEGTQVLGKRDASVLGAVADCSNAMVGCETPEDFERVAAKFKQVLGIPADRLQSIRKECLDRASAGAAQIGLNLAELTTKSPAAAKTDSAAQAGADRLVVTGQFAAPTDSAEIAAQRQNLLVAGISDISQTLAGEFELLQVMRIIVETVYRGSPFERVMLFTKDQAATSIVCRLAFGAGTEPFVRDRFQISLAPSRNVFYGCLSRSADLVISDTAGEKIAPYLPDWYKPRFAAVSALLLPITSQNKVLGMIYADSVDTRVAELQQSEMGLLRTLRSQAALAMKQKGLC